MAITCCRFLQLIKPDALPPRQKYQVLSETHFVLPWAYVIVINPRVFDAVAGLLGSNLLTWNSNWFTKMPGEKSYVGWHQDGTYWKLNPPNAGPRRPSCVINLTF